MILFELVREVLAKLSREEGQTAVEYGLVLALIAVVLVVALASGLSGALDTVITDITSKL